MIAAHGVLNVATNEFGFYLSRTSIIPTSYFLGTNLTFKLKFHPLFFNDFQ